MEKSKLRFVFILFLCLCTLMNISACTGSGMAVSKTEVVLGKVFPEGKNIFFSDKSEFDTEIKELCISLRMNRCIRLNSL
ncbi:MAG: hypothetical protein VB118_03840 [Oscillospiraceae bacterium]|nr:hypothetical protein [Oscillospiraceae bacterium]